MPYSIRLTDVEDARDQLLPIWTQNLPIRGEVDAKLRWFYVDGPHGPGHAFVIHPELDRAPIGSAGVGVRTLRFHDRPIRAALFADLAIERPHRSGLPALALVRAVRHHVTESFDVGYGFPNAKAAAVYRRGGYRQLGEMKRYVRVLRSGTYLERRLRVPYLGRAAGAVADRVLVAAARARSWRRPGVELTWQDGFDRRFDRLWEEGRRLAPILCERSSAFLTWRFAHHPGHDYRIAALTDRGTRQLRAYAVVRDAGPVAELADLFGAGKHELDSLLVRLLPALYDLGYRSVGFRFLGSPQVPALLGKHGFALRGGSRMVALAIGQRMAHELALADPGSWYLTDLDEDS